MIKDISKIREYLDGYVEVELPYEFIKIHLFSILLVNMMMKEIFFM